MSTEPDDKEIATIKKLIGKIGPILHGHPPIVQSAVLADLLATWIAGHFVVEGTRAATAAYRELLLERHIDLVRDLIKPNEDQLLQRHQRP